jgi:type III secretion protein L
MSRVVKGPGRGGAVMPAAVYDAHEEARRLVAAARAEAAALRAAAEEERQAARRAGQAQGRDEGRAEVAGLLVAARAAAARLQTEAAAELRTLAVRIAEKVLGRTLAAAPELCADVAAEALRAARHQRRVLLRAHPDDLAALEAARPRLRQLLDHAPDLDLRGDPTIDRGGCVVETEVGVIDARLATQLAAIERALAGEADAAAGGDGAEAPP